MAAHDSTTATGTRSITKPQAAPRRRHYHPEPTPLHELPFVARRPQGQPGLMGWNVPPTDDYNHACKVGAEYAGHLLQFLKENPFWVGSTLAEIVSAMDFSDEGAAKGYRVGFLHHLERVLYAQAIRSDEFADVDTTLAGYAAIEEQVDALSREAP